MIGKKIPGSAKIADNIDRLHADRQRREAELAELTRRQAELSEALPTTLARVELGEADPGQARQIRDQVAAVGEQLEAKRHALDELRRVVVQLEARHREALAEENHAEREQLAADFRKHADKARELFEEALRFALAAAAAADREDALRRDSSVMRDHYVPAPSVIEPDPLIGAIVGARGGLEQSELAFRAMAVAGVRR